jgi:hypothetical protein
MSECVFSKSTFRELFFGGESSIDEKEETGTLGSVVQIVPQLKEGAASVLRPSLRSGKSSLTAGSSELFVWREARKPAISLFSMLDIFLNFLLFFGQSFLDFLVFRIYFLQIPCLQVQSVAKKFGWFLDGPQCS